MSKNDKNKLVPDYLDVSSDEDNKKKNEVVEESHLKKESKSRNYKNDEKSYDYDDDYSYKHKYEDKYYHSRRKSRSTSKSRTHSRNNYRSSRSKSKNFYRHNRSRSRNYYSRSRSKNYYRYSRSRSRSRRYRARDYSRSKSSRNRSQSRNYYKNSKNRSRSRSDIDKKKDEYDRYDKNKINDNYNKGEELKDKYDIKKEEKNEYSNKKVDKWSDGIKKEDFKSIKIEKYDKHKRANQNSSKEISQLKKDLKKSKKEYEGEEEEEIIEKEKPNFEPSGILQKDLQDEYNASMNNKVAINYKPPSDSIIPEEIWFLFKFLKDKKEADETYKLVGKEFFLIGKDNRICDIHIKQKNISRQHAVIQFRKIAKNNKDGNSVSIIPYLIDLNSTNGTYLNGDKIDNSKYYELMDKDNLNFGDKKIDFVLMQMK